MKTDPASCKAKRVILLLGVFAFIFHSLGTNFQPAMAATTNGYHETICTLYGPKIVFVSFEDDRPQTPPNCLECPTCIVQTNADGWLVADSSSAELGFVKYQPERAEVLCPVSPDSPYFPRFLSRAPPL